MSSKPIRILQVVGQIAGGGVGGWLLNIMRRMSPRYRFDFLAYHPEPPDVVRNIEDRGGKVLLCGDPHRPWAFAIRFVKLLRRHGPYDIIHCHLFTYCGLIVYLAYLMNVPQRVVHSHTDRSHQESSRDNLFRSAYLALMKNWIGSYATRGLAVSKAAARDLFGNAWAEDSRVSILYCGIDLSPFSEVGEPSAIRKELALPPEALVVGHVGRFVHLKNQAFVLDIARELLKSESRAYVLLVGDGPLRPDFERIAHQSGVADHVRFLGLRSDVPRLMLGAMDVVLLPSRYEGLPLVLLEAQAAGKVSIFSDNITPEVEVIPTLMRRLPLSASPGKWAQAILQVRDQPPPLSQKEAFDIMAASHFNLEVSTQELKNIFAESGSTA